MEGLLLTRLLSSSSPSWLEGKFLSPGFKKLWADPVLSLKYSLPSVLCTLHYPAQPGSTYYALHCTLYSTLSSTVWLYLVRFTLYSVLYTIQHSLSVLITLYTVRCTLYLIPNCKVSLSLPIYWGPWSQGSTSSQQKHLPIKVYVVKRGLLIHEAKRSLIWCLVLFGFVDTLAPGPDNLLKAIWLSSYECTCTECKPVFTPRYIMPHCHTEHGSPASNADCRLCLSNGHPTLGLLTLLHHIYMSTTDAG